MRRVGVRSVLFAGLTVASAAACGGSEARSASGDADGEALYAASCASCHGADLTGSELGPSHLSIVYEPGHHPDETFEAAIRDGAPEHHWDFGPMPPIEGLEDDEVDAIIEFIRSEQARRGFEG